MGSVDLFRSEGKKASRNLQEFARICTSLQSFPSLIQSDAIGLAFSGRLKAVECVWEAWPSAKRSSRQSQASMETERNPLVSFELLLSNETREANKQCTFASGFELEAAI